MQFRLPIARTLTAFRSQLISAASAGHKGGASDIGAVELANTSHGTKLFAVSAQGENSTNEVFRYEVEPHRATDTGPNDDA